MVELSSDQLLKHPGHTQADNFGHLARLHTSEQLEQVMIGEGHRRVLLREFWLGTRRVSRRWPTQQVDPSVSQLHHHRGYQHARIRLAGQVAIVIGGGRGIGRAEASTPLLDDHDQPYIEYSRTRATPQHLWRGTTN